MNSEVIKIVITTEFVGERLDKFLSLQPQVSSRSYAQNLIEKNFALVNNKKVKSSYLLALNDIVTLEVPPAQPTDLIPWNYNLDIVYEDSELLVINKPSGLVVHPAHGHEQDTLVNALIYHTKNLSMKNEQRPGIVHRIDKETSGLLVVAKNDRAHDHLALQFKNKTSHRVYWALVEGSLKSKSGVIESYLSRHPTDRKRFASTKDHLETAKWAKTHYSLMQKSSSMSYVELKLETGRTHQIRVHMKELGHVLVGDLIYGYKKSLYDKFELSRFYLHAAELGFVHPTTEQQLKFKVNWPEEDLKKIRQFGFKL